MSNAQNTDMKTLVAFHIFLLREGKSALFLESIREFTDGWQP